MCSTEQLDVINSVKSGNIVVVDAVAGSGKTTTVLGMAKAHPEKSIIQITYNSQLKLEVRQKVVERDITNLEIHTYHSLTVSYYNNEGFNDQIIAKVIDDNQQAFKDLPKCDILVIDESQDMTKLYFNLIRKFIRDLSISSNELSLVVLGDKYQGVYDFKEADTRFLTHAPQLWENFVPIHKTMSTSYRVTKPIAWFVNNVLVGQNRINSVKDGPPIHYIRHDCWKAHTVFLPIIIDLLKHDILPDDIFVLTSSLRSNKSPFTKLENALVKSGIRCYVPRNEDQRLSTENIKGKVVFSTFHQAKGRERKIVIVYGFDSSFYEFAGRNLDPTVCPSVLYVAVTRACQQLFLLVDPNQVPLPFFHLSESEIANNENVIFSGNPCNEKFQNAEEEESNYCVSATSLVRYIKEPIFAKLYQLIPDLFVTERESFNIVDMPIRIINKDGTCEDISALNGMALTAMFADHQHGNCLIREIVEYAGETTKDKFLLNEIQKVDTSTPAGYLHMVNVFSAVNAGLYHTLAQISDYGWLTDEMVGQCFENIESAVDSKVTFEMRLKKYRYKSPNVTVDLLGTVDACNGQTVWEFKCVGGISIEHLLQLIVYAWIWNGSMKKTHGEKKFKLMNIRTGKILALNYDRRKVKAVIDILIENKFVVADRKNDDEFVSWVNVK